ncbi:hypothetical protein NDU88_003708, partial [Pleurodeles waltl]
STSIKSETYGRPLQTRCGPWGFISSSAWIAGIHGSASNAGPGSQPMSRSAKPPN